ncbi:unnamed protein product [Adineta steineri]|uniref:TRPM-like domain-containing protein n=1 Tax=Adineta steineri TaxID=433720 RepID=A0A814J0W1_9BILA|nr:unnamed protein product [Adineta steineri]
MYTKQEVTYCYGILPQSTSPYLRCDVKTDLEQLCFVLLGVWDVAIPGLIMRMIDAWIITNGYKEESISELVGEVMYNCRMNNSHINFSAIAVGSYKSSKSDNQNGIFTESEDDLDIATINETFLEDGETSVSSNKQTLKEMLRSLGKFRLDFVNDVRKIYHIVRQQNYETQGKRLPVGELLSLEEEKALGKYLYQMASCLNASFRDNIHIFNIDSSKSLKETIYYVFVQEEKDLVIVLQKLVGDFMLSLYDTQSDDDKENIDAEHIYRDLFLWCILTYRLDMAKIFLSQLKTRICSALIASKILNSLAAYAPDQAAKDTLFAKANDFETHAIEFVRCAYFNDKHKACELIMRCTNLYGGVTCLQMAIAADNKRFVHEDACQALLTNIWYDRVDPVQERKRLVVNILTFGIFQFFISIYLKIVMALDLELSFIRSVLFIGIASDLGPKIVMIRKMVVYPVYYFVHGSIDNERTQLEATPDSGTTIVTQIIFAFYMLCSGIFTINDIQTQARYVWAYDRCDIIRTYYTRPALFPPFTFLISIMQCFQWCWRKLYRNRNGKEEQSQCFSK